eukprot:12912305-Prorocentrum_lima.AAC.1
MALKGSATQRSLEVIRDDSELRALLPYHDDDWDVDSVTTRAMCRKIVVRFWEAGLIDDTDAQGWEERVTKLHRAF